MRQVYVKQNWDKQECVLIELALSPVLWPPLHCFCFFFSNLSDFRLLPLGNDGSQDNPQISVKIGLALVSKFGSLREKEQQINFSSNTCPFQLAENGNPIYLSGRLKKQPSVAVARQSSLDAAPTRHTVRSNRRTKHIPHYLLCSQGNRVPPWLVYSSTSPTQQTFTAKDPALRDFSFQGSTTSPPLTCFLPHLAAWS